MSACHFFCCYSDILSYFCIMNMTRIYVSRMTHMDSACHRHEIGMSSALFGFWDDEHSAPHPDAERTGGPGKTEAESTGGPRKI